MTAAQSRIWRQFDKFVVNSVAPFAQRAERLLIIEGNRAAEAYRAGGEAAADAAVTDKPWTIYISRLWLAVAPQAGDMMTEWLRAASLSMKAGTGTPGIELMKAKPADPFDRAVTAWLRVNGGQKVTAVTDTSRREIGDQIRIGVNKNESRQQIADRITKHRRSIAPGRAHTIARTEVHAAANYGSWVAAAEVSVAVDKVWVATPDGRARDAHLAANGQRRGLNAYFEVGGAQLMFPGDSRGSPGQVINCRCVQNFVVARAPARRRPRAA